MKSKLFPLIPVLVVTGIMMTSCMSSGSRGKNVQAGDGQEVSAQEDDVKVVDTRPRVYACAYDGFVNIRESPSGKAEVLGKFENGPEGAAWLGEEGNWTQIDKDGIVGYVLSQYVTSEPTVAVDEGISMSWLEGMWSEAEHFSDDFTLYFGLLIFDNGQYMEYNANYCEGAFSGWGTFQLEGSNLVLTQTWNDVMEEKCNTKTVLKLNPDKKRIEGYKKVRFLKDNEPFDEDEWLGSGALILTKKEFRRRASTR